MQTAVEKPLFTVNQNAPVQRLAALGDGLVVVLYEGSAAVLNCSGTLRWSSLIQHVGLTTMGSAAVLLEPEGGGTLLTSSSSGGVLAEDLFLDRAAGGDGISAIAAGHESVALACGR